jgi:hypothetical protein
MRLLKKVVPVFPLALCLTSLAIAQQDETQRITQRVKPAVVFIQAFVQGRPILVTEQGPRPLEPIAYGSSGSGFIINPDGYIITNGHVIADVAEKDTRLNEIIEELRQRVLTRDIYPSYAQNGEMPNAAARRAIAAQWRNAIHITDLRFSIEVALPNWTFYPAEIKRYSPPIYQGGKDIAILKIEAKNLPTIKLGDSEKVQEQDLVIPVGYPGAAQFNPMLSRSSALSPTITSGHISSLKFDLKGTPVIQTDAAITHGSSGGPAFDREGDVIGVATFGSVEGGREVAGFNFLVPVNTAKEFVRELGITTNQASLFDQLWMEALDLYNAEKYRSAIAKFDEVLRALPNYEEAKKLQLRSQEYLNQHPVLSIVKEYTGLMVGGGVVLALIVVGVVVALQRKKALARPQPTAVPIQTQPPMPPQPSPQAQTQRQVFGSLICTAGPLAGRKFEIDKKGVWIGRDSSKCQVVLADENVSREHAWIVPLEDNKVVVIDKGSSNGTFINSVDAARVSKVELKAGDTIIIGKMAVAKFTFQPS